MVNEVPFFAAGVVGLGPALFFTFFSLRRYEYPYVEEALFRNDRLFLSFAVGMVAGVASALIFNAFPVNFFTTALIVLLLTATFEESFKLVYLNLKFLQGKFDTVFYGASAGLGMAATFVMAFAFQTFSGGLDPFSPVNVLTLLTLSIALGALHFATGSLLGIGAAQRLLWRSYLQAMGARLVFAVLLAPFLAPFQVLNVALLVLFFLAATFFALYLYRESLLSFIPDSLPVEVRRRLRRGPLKSRAGGS